MTKAELVRELEPFEDDTLVVTADLMPVRVEYSEGMLVITDEEPWEGEMGEAEDELEALLEQMRWEGEGGANG